jgi:hypothetical protein
MIKTGSMPEGGANPLHSRRQRWQVNSALSPEEQEAEIRRLGVALDDSKIVPREEEYHEALQIKFINVGAAKMPSPRLHTGWGCIALTMPSTLLQITLEPNFRATSMHSARLRQDIMPLWRLTWLILRTNQLTWVPTTHPLSEMVAP